MSKKKVVVLGVTGSIAAYKAAELCSQMIKTGIEVHVIMTESALHLIGEQTFFTLSQQQVITDLWKIPKWQPGHIDLSEKADLFVVVPCSANFIGKYTNGIADDALTTFALAHDGPVILAPGMNPKMWKHPAVQDNVKKLKSRGVHFVGPVSGRTACGSEKGPGRMAEPTKIYTVIDTLIHKR